MYQIMKIYRLNKNYNKILLVHDLKHREILVNMTVLSN